MPDQLPPDPPDSSKIDEIDSVYGETSIAPDLQESALRTSFLPWHHPVKQVVRDTQWSKLTEQLIIRERESHFSVLRYFTLPGEDLLDVRTLAAVCQPRRIQIEYFGYNTAAADGGRGAVRAAALRQAGITTSNAQVVLGRLEDIAARNSHEARRLSDCNHFDVINIDACDHLSYRPEGHERCTFDAIHTLMQHQMTAKQSWLLFITTRVKPSLLGDPGMKFQQAIHDNLAYKPKEFGAALSEALEAKRDLLTTAVAQAWANSGDKFLKLYSIGVGKYLLQFFHSQQNMPARVQLASACAYRVHEESPDMLALAFKITPAGIRSLPPGTGGATTAPLLEIEHAIHVAKHAQNLRDLDREMRDRQTVLAAAVQGSAKLLREVGYDIGAWREWLAGHPIRPLTFAQTNLPL